MLSIRLLGTPQIFLDQHPVTISRRKSRALLYYLAVQMEPVARDQLLAFFWPDHNRGAAQGTLRTTLYNLRQSIGSALLAEGDTISLTAEAEVDTRIFEASVSQSDNDIAQLSTSLDHYRGEFLAGFTLPDPPEFDDWVMIERERYRRLAIKGLKRLSQRYEAQQEYRSALETLERALAFDPLQEQVQRESLRLHYLSGDRAGAIRRYEKLVRLLDEEMGVPPMAETRALYDAIITDTLPNISHQATRSDRIVQPQPPTAGPSIRPDQLPFIGRKIELQQLQKIAGIHKLTIIEGEPGIGKTRLIEEYIQSAPSGLAHLSPIDAKPLLTLQGQARELEQTLPYQPIIEALRNLITDPDWLTLKLKLNLPEFWLSEVIRLLPELSVAGPGLPLTYLATDESRLWEGVLQFLQAIAHHRSLLFILDDLHWASPSTLGLVGYLVRQAGIRSTPIIFLAASQPASGASPLAALQQSLKREQRLERLRLKRLSREEVIALAHRLSKRYAQPLANWLNRGSEGNPFILAELVRYARTHKILRPDGRLDLAKLPESPAVPDMVYALIQSRLSHLSDTARRILDAAVVIGREFEFEIVARAADVADDAALDALDELQMTGLIYPSTTDNLRYLFDHNLTRVVASREMGEVRRRLLHRRVAEAMENLSSYQLDSIAGLLVHHFSEAQIPERAAEYAFRAGQRAADLAAWGETITFYEQALSGAERTGNETQRKAILLAIGQACLQAGNYDRATELLQEALTLAQEQADHIYARKAYIALSETFLLQARYSDVIALARQLASGHRSEQLVDAEYMWGNALSQEGADLVGAAEHLQQAEAILQQQQKEYAVSSLPTTYDTLLAQIKFELGRVAAQQGNLAGAITHYREALAATENLNTNAALHIHILAQNNLAYHLHLLDDLTAADYLQAGLELAHEKGAFYLLPYLFSTQGEIALTRGDLSAAETHFNEGLSLATQFSAGERIAGLTANLGLVAAQQGKTELAIQRLSTALEQAANLNTYYLAVQIRLWLIPLLPSDEAQNYLTEAKAIARQGGYRRLIDEADRLSRHLSRFHS